ncbi:MAG: polysaccharide biosynthesis protein [Bacteroides sp.]|nr:polysaccharide biosynthesis protein [Bacteroides sp.]
MNILQNFARWYFSRRALPFWGILILDSLIVVAAGVLVAVLTEGPMHALLNWKNLAIAMVVYLWCYLTGFRTLHTYSGVIRYSTFVDLQRVAFANIIGMGLCYLVRWGMGLAGYVPTLDYIDLLTMCMLATLMMWFLRVVVKFVYDMGYHSSRAKRVFIYGTRRGGVSLAKSIRSEEMSRYVLAGFVSEDDKYIGRRMMGVRVVKNDLSLVEEMKMRGATVLLVSPIYSEKFREDSALVDKLIEENIHIHMMPKSYEWDGKSDLNFTMLKEVDIEDLLPREKIEIDMDRVGGMLTNKRILITGAAGSIGSEMVRQVAVYHPLELILIDQAETPMHDVRLYMKKHHPNIETHTIVTSISNASRMEEIYKAYRPEYVFHAAAYKHVPMMEDNPSEAVQNNIYGTRVMADLAVKYGTRKFVMVSTDKAVNPTNVMGCSKRICEIYVQSLDKAIKSGKVKGVTQFVTTRFGNVLGSNGSVIPLFREQIRNGGPITVTHPDIIRYFMLIPEACKLVLEAGTMGNGGEIYIFDMGKPVRIADLAKRMIKLSGATNVRVEYTGLRDGEKLFEELLNDTEVTKPTHHPKIKIAAVREYEYADAKREEDELYELSFGYNAMEVVKKMKQIVPEFKSQHSPYEVLD